LECGGNPDASGDTALELSFASANQSAVPDASGLRSAGAL
jgi:hypothetical protein